MCHDVAVALTVAVAVAGAGAGAVVAGADAVLPSHPFFISIILI